MGVWLSLDVATKTGVAVWDGDRLVTTFVVRPHPKGTSALKVGARWVVDDGQPRPRVYRGELGVWRAVLRRCPDVPFGLVLEEVFIGSSPKAARILAERRGRALGLLEALGVAELGRVLAAEWRRSVSTTWSRPVAWPSDGEACKDLAQALVRERWGLDVTADEADAILVGWWAQVTGASPNGAQRG